MVKKAVWLMGLALAGMACWNAWAVDYFVATNGLDGNPGTLAAPFRTVQRASSAAAAGQTIYIRGGVYREYVAPVNSGTAGSPIRYQAYNGEPVTISGADAITGTWSVHSGNIYKINVGSLRFDQLFVDGQMQLKAQWPDNPSMEPLTTNAWMAKAEIGDGTSMMDYELPAGDWTGARFWTLPGDEWVGIHGFVTNSDAGQRKVFVYPPVGQANKKYYLYDTLIALTRGGEWYLNKSTGDLYLWTLAGDNPGNHKVEYRKAVVPFWNPQAYATTNTPVLKIASTKSHIEFDGIDFFAGEVWVQGAYCTIKNGQIKYAEYFENSYLYVDKSFPVWVAGNHNKLERMEVSYSAGAGIRLAGMSNEVAYCTIHDVNWTGGEYGAIRYGSWGDIHYTAPYQEYLYEENGFLHVHHNTMYNMGRAGILGHNTDGLRLEYNDVRNAGILCEDTGIFYTDHNGATNGNQSVIAYNVFENIQNKFGAGVYFDNGYDGGRNYVCHHNILIARNHGGRTAGIMVNATSTNQTALTGRLKFYNNVLYDNQWLSIRIYTGWPGIYPLEIKNNIVFNCGPKETYGGDVYSYNFDSGNPLFLNAPAGDFRLQTNSPCINAGVALSPYTDGYVGAAPDQGAYEYGGVDWVAGAEDVVAPLPPTNLVATAVSAGRIDLRWKDASTNETGFKIERKPAGGSYEEIATTAANVTNYSDVGVLGNRQYFYRMRASNAGGDSGYSDEANATTPPDTEAPSVPGNVTVTEVTDRSVSLAWTASTDNVGVVAYRILESGSVVGSNTAASFTHSGLTPNTPYSYTVQAGDAAGNWSAASAPPTGATTLDAVPFPTNGLVGYWPLDENGGTTANDASGNGYHGTLAGANTPVWTAPGKVGASSLLFNIQNYGNPSRVDLPAGPDALATNNGFTISAWCKPNAAPGANYCKTTVLAGQTANNDTGGNVLGYYYNASGDYRFYMRFGYGTGNNTAYTAMSPAHSPFGVWYHVVGVVDRAGGTVKVYINGVSAATNVFAGGTAAYAYWPIYHWKFGAWGSNREDPNYGQQTLDEVRFYNRALNAGEVMALAGIAPPDTQAPTLSVVTPANLSYTTNSQAAVTGTAADASGVASVTVNGVAAWTSNGFTNWNRTVTGLAVGTNVLTVVGVDTPGNAATNVVRVIYAAGTFDGNGDGLPDAWQIQYFGFGFKTNALAAPDADADDDGMNNRDEQIAGTNPNDPADCLKVSDAQTLPGGGFTVQWKSISGHVYEVQWSTNLAGWSSLAPAVTAVAPNTSVTDIDAGQVTNRFYRVRQP